MFQLKNTRWSLAILAGLLVGCSGEQVFPTRSEAIAPPAASGPALQSGSGYQVQQELTPGPKGSRRRVRYCRQWQCAFSADKNWCMRRCVYAWDL